MLVALNRNDVADAASGKPRVNFTRNASIKMDWRVGARNAQTKLPTIAADDGGWQWGIENLRSDIQVNVSKDDTCEMCGHHVAVRQKAHIVAEGKKRGNNLLMLCPSCHVTFDTHLKPKMYRALVEAGVEGLPKSWRLSIYEQAAKASQAIRRRRQST